MTAQERIIDRITILINEKEITKYRLSKDLDLANGIFTQWEQDKAKPSTEALVKIANYFDVTVDYLLGRTPTVIDLGKLETQAEPQTAKTFTVENILKLLRENNLTEYDISRILELSSSVLSQWKSGRQQPGIEVLIKFANFFNVSLDYLCGREIQQNTHASAQPKFIQELSASPKTIQDMTERYFYDLKKIMAQDEEQRKMQSDSLAK